MRVKTESLSDAALNWAVCKCEHPEAASITATHYTVDFGFESDDFVIPDYSGMWGEAGPIVEGEVISLVQLNDLYFPEGDEKSEHFEPYWRATKAGTPTSERTHYRAHGKSAIEAAMRCYVMSKLGDEVDIPEELCQ